MPCNLYRSPDGSFVSICCGRKKITRCYKCGFPSTSLCDYPIGNGKTCDKPMCNKCKTNIGNNIDVCQEHSGAEDVNKTLMEQERSRS